MSKNMKFLRNGALLLAVLAMVLGQCFGMLGGVVAKAAYESTQPYDVTFIEWDTQLPSRLLAGGSASEVTISVGLKATADTKETTVGGQRLINVFSAENATAAYTSGTYVTPTYGTVTIPALAKGETTTVEIKLGIAGNRAAAAATILIADANIAGKPWKDIGQGTELSEVVTVGVVEGAGWLAEGMSSAATKLWVAHRDPITGDNVNAVPVSFGDTLKNLGVWTTNEDQFGDHYSVKDSGSLTKVLNQTTGEELQGLSFVNGRLSLDTYTVKYPTFVKGVNTLRIEYANENGKALYATARVDVKATTPVVTLRGEDCLAEAEDDWQAIANVTDDDRRQKIKLVAEVTGLPDDYAFAHVKGDELPLEGYIVFKDNGKVIGQVNLGECLDKIPVTSNHDTKLNVTEIGKACIGFIVSKGAHSFTAEYVPANEATKVLSGATTEKAIDVTYDKVLANRAIISYDPATLIAGESTKITLRFEDAAPGKGTASFKIYNATTLKVETTIRFALNATDKTYSTTVALPEAGKYIIGDNESDGTRRAGYVSFVMDAPTKIFGSTNLATFTERMIQVGYDLDERDQKIYCVEVYKQATTTDLTADKTSLKHGETIKLTAAVKDDTAKAVVVGNVTFYAIHADKTLAQIGTVKSLAATASLANAEKGIVSMEYKVVDPTIIGFAAYYDGVKYTFAPSSDKLDAGIVFEKGSLKVMEAPDVLDGTKPAIFKVAILDKNGDIAKVTGGEVKITHFDYEAWDETWEFDTVKAYVYDGVATIEIPAEVVAEMSQGDHAVDFQLTDDTYGVLTTKGKLTIAPYDQEPVVLRCTDTSVIDRNVQVLDALLSDDLELTLDDPDLTGHYTDADGYLTFYLGDIKIYKSEIEDGVATFSDDELMALFIGKDMPLTVKYSGSKKYAPTELSLGNVTVSKAALPMAEKLFNATAVNDKLTIRLLGDPYQLGGDPEDMNVAGMLRMINSELKALGNGPMATASFQIMANGRVIDEIPVTADTPAVIEAIISDPALKGETKITVKLVTNFIVGHEENVDMILTAASGWVEIDGSWYYYNDGEMAANEWVKDSGYWYFMNVEGIMLKGWQKLEWNGKSDWYYFKPASPNSGAMLTGWQLIDGKWYFMNGSGVMQTGWIKLGSTWFYLKDSGAMVTGWQQISWNGVTNWYYFDKGGHMATSGTIDGWNIAPSGIATKA